MVGDGRRVHPGVGVGDGCRRSCLGSVRVVVFRCARDERVERRVAGVLGVELAERVPVGGVGRGRRRAPPVDVRLGDAVEAGWWCVQGLRGALCVRRYGFVCVCVCVCVCEYKKRSVFYIFTDQGMHT